MERKPLGRGLSSLLAGTMPQEPGGRILQISIDEIAPNPHQPRQQWNEESLAELAESIREHGIIQPLLVRGRPGSYELVAGERRLRASRLAGLTHVPAIIKEAGDEDLLKLALIENIQREDISAVEAARAYQRLIDDFSMTQEEVASAVGKSRPAITNALRMLRLPSPILQSLQSRAITEGHARALLAADDPDEQNRLWEMACAGASVRDIEAAVRKQKPVPTVESPPSTLRTIVRKNPQPQPHLQALMDQLRRALGVKVEIRGDQRSGMLCLEYYSEDDLQALADRLLGVSTTD